MKKLITVFLILALILPAAAIADDSDIIGVWVSTEILEEGSPQMSYLYLAEDHTCYFVIQMFHKNEPGIGRQYVGKWETLSSGDIYAKTGNNTSTTMRVSGNYAMNRETGTIYTHVLTTTLNELLGD